MIHIERLKLNPRLLFWGRALNEIKALNAFVSLFYLARGVRVDQIFYLSIIWAAVDIIAEIPTGYLADRLGRKTMMLIGTGIHVLSFVISFFAHGFWQFAVVMALYALAWACFSGTEEALLYDSLKEVGSEETMTRANGRLHAARSLFKIFIPSVAAFVAKDLLEPQFQILITTNLLFCVAAFVVLMFIKEPRHYKKVAAYEVGILRESIKTIHREPFLFRAAINKILVFLASLVVWRAYQPVFAEHGLTGVWLGIYYISFHSIVFIAHWHVSALVQKFGAVKLLRGTAALIIAALAIGFFATAPWLIFLALWLPLVLEGVREPVFAHAMNRLISSRSRATTLSNLNFLKGIFQIPIMGLAGWLSLTRVEYTYWLAALLCAAVIFWFPIRAHELAAPALKQELNVE